MALAAGTTWEIRTTGSDGNGGGFNPNRGGGGVDRSQQDAAFITIDGVTITATVNAATDTLDLTGVVAIAAHLGNLVNITGGTATAGVYEIIAIPTAGRWQLDRAAGTAGQTATGAMGGAAASLGWVCGKQSDLNIIWVKAGTYLITSTTNNISGGRFTTQRSFYWGYQTTRGDFSATRPKMQASGVNTFTIATLGGNGVIVGNIDVDGNNQAAVVGFASGQTVWRCTAFNCTNGGFNPGANSNVRFIECRATGCSGVQGFVGNATSDQALYNCIADANTAGGFLWSGSLERCLAFGNTGAAGHGFSTSAQTTMRNCVSYGNGGDGFRTVGDGGSGTRYINCIAEGNAGFDFNPTGVGVLSGQEIRINCASFNNGSTATDANFVLSLNHLALTVSPFNNAAGGDFRLNSNPLGGALLVNVATPTLMNGFATGYNVGLMQGVTNTGGAGGGGGSQVLGDVWG